MTYRDRLESVRRECRDYIEMYMEEFEHFDIIGLEMTQDYPEDGTFELSFMRIEDGKVYILGEHINWGTERDFDLDDISADGLADIADFMKKEYKLQKYGDRHTDTQL